MNGEETRCMYREEIPWMHREEVRWRDLIVQ
jgi:hypothetical protein